MHLAARLLPTAPTSPSTQGSTWVSSLTGVRFVSASSPSYHIYSSTSEHTQGTNLTSAEFRVSQSDLDRKTVDKKVSKEVFVGEVVVSDDISLTVAQSLLSNTKHQHFIPIELYRIAKTSRLPEEIGTIFLLLFFHRRLHQGLLPAVQPAVPLEVPPD